jgi:hypothetical protein
VLAIANFSTYLGHFQAEFFEFCKAEKYCISMTHVHCGHVYCFCRLHTKQMLKKCDKLKKVGIWGGGGEETKIIIFHGSHNSSQLSQECRVKTLDIQSTVTDCVLCIYQIFECCTWCFLPILHFLHCLISTSSLCLTHEPEPNNKWLFWSMTWAWLEIL